MIQFLEQKARCDRRFLKQAIALQPKTKGIEFYQSNHCLTYQRRDH
jgi:hypothetical protein